MMQSQRFFEYVDTLDWAGDDVQVSRLRAFPNRKVSDPLTEGGSQVSRETKSSKNDIYEFIQTDSGLNKQDQSVSPEEDIDLRTIKVYHFSDESYKKKLNGMITFGKIGENYTPVPCACFSDAEAACVVVNHTLRHPKFAMNSGNIAEFYFFRERIPPHWIYAKEMSGANVIMETAVRFPDTTPEISLNIVEHLFFGFIGETLIENTEEIIGIRVKPSFRGGDVRFWSKTYQWTDLKENIDKVIIKYTKNLNSEYKYSIFQKEIKPPEETPSMQIIDKYISNGKVYTKNAADNEKVRVNVSDKKSMNIPNKKPVNVPNKQPFTKNYSNQGRK